MEDARETLARLIAAGQETGYIPEFGLSKLYPRNALTENHADLLRQSGISAEMAEARMYVSVINGAFFKENIHVPSWTRLAPCLFIPIWDVTGRATQCQIRPDNPRIIRGKKVKYESLPSTALKLDIPPSVLSRLGDPSKDLIITEGARKADAAISRGAVCISLIGVWGFRGKNEKGGNTALTDWDSVALNGRRVKIVFDSDVVSKASVGLALQRLRGFLESRSATVEIVFLPNDENGDKVGLDDFLINHKIEDLDEFIQKVDRVSKDTSYTIAEGRFVMTRGEKIEPLCNFTAKIIKEEVQDNGLVQEKFYHIAGSTYDSSPLPTIVVPVDEYNMMYWVETGWMTRVQMAAGRATRDHIATAIKANSQNAPTQRTFTHTGWRSVDDNYLYLHAGGSIPEQDSSKVTINIIGSLIHTRIEEPNGKLDSGNVIKRFIDLGPTEITLPLISAVFCAVLGEFITLDFAVHLEGPTGSFKSEIASLLQGFWGRTFDSRHLPANWSSTPFALEQQAFIAKDMIFVIDDFAPQPGRSAQETLAHKAEVLFRGAGNQAGRVRLNSELKVRPDYFPRGLIISTGEDTVAGQSINARLVNIHIDPGDVDPHKLSEMQILRDKGVLTQILHSFIEWIHKKLPFDFDTMFTSYREKILRLPSLHKRNIASISKLLVAWDLLCDFLEDDDLKEFGEKGLLSIIAEQAQKQIEENIANKAIERLRSALRSGDAYLEILDKGEEVDPNLRDRYGYKLIDGSLRSLGNRLGHVEKSGQEHLDLNRVHETIWKNIGASRNGLAAALEQEGWIVREGRQWGTVVRWRGITVRTYMLKKKLFDFLPGSDDVEVPNSLNFADLFKDG